MFPGAKKDFYVDTSSPSEPRPQVFNSVGMMTRSQLAASARTPKTPSRGPLTTGRGIVASPVMFYHEDSPYSTHIAIVTVNVTCTSQETEATIVGPRGSQDFSTDPTTNIENIDLRDYYFGSEREHTTTIE